MRDPENSIVVPSLRTGKGRGGERASGRFLTFSQPNSVLQCHLLSYFAEDGRCLSPISTLRFNSITIHTYLGRPGRYMRQGGRAGVRAGVRAVGRVYLGLFGFRLILFSLPKPSGSRQLSLEKKMTCI